MIAVFFLFLVAFAMSSPVTPHEGTSTVKVGPPSLVNIPERRYDPKGPQIQPFPDDFRPQVLVDPVPADKPKTPKLP